MKKIVLLLLLAVGLMACHRPLRVVEATSEVIIVDSTLDIIQDTAYLQHLAPFKAELEAALNAPIGYAPDALTVKNQNVICSIGRATHSYLWRASSALTT